MTHAATEAPASPLGRHFTRNFSNSSLVKLWVTALKDVF
jgi:hypothetical protein